MSSWPQSAAGIAWARRNLFSTWYNTLITAALVWLAWALLVPFLKWALVDAVWGAASPARCQAAGGACWAFIVEKSRLIFFGLQPAGEEWRPALAAALVLGAALAGAMRQLRSKWFPLIWIAVLSTAVSLTYGAIPGVTGPLFGMTIVETANWGGLPLTVGLSAVGLTAAFPLGVLLALGRRSQTPVLRALCIGFIELIRGVPLITILFMASVMLPIFLPPGATLNELLRAQIAIILFAAAYLAEAVRGGLQALPKGQYEAADSLGLSYWRKTALVILPQALTTVIPPIANTVIAVFKDTSLVITIGLFELLGGARLGLTDPPWASFYKEAYLFVSLIFFSFCFAISRYSQRLEVEFRSGRPARETTPMSASVLPE